MRVIRDSDTVEFTDSDGDKLVLLSAPRQRDVNACDIIARDEAMSEMDRLKATGVDTDKILADAQKDPDALKKAQANVRNAPDSVKVREFRLKALAVRMFINSENIGGEQVIRQYGDMDPVSSAWVDEQVKSVWEAAIPSDASARGPAPDAELPVEPANGAAQ